MTCRRGPHCAARHEWNGPAPADRPLCARDESELDRVLREFGGHDGLLAHLRAAALAALPGHAATERTAGGDVDPPLPFRADLDELADQLVATVVEWAWIVASVSGVPGPPPGRHYPGRALQHAVTILRGRMSVLMALQPWTVTRYGIGADMDGGDAALELFELHHRVLAVLGRTRKLLHLPEPCPDCGVKLVLCHYAGHNEVRCAACNADFRLDDIQGKPVTDTSLIALGDNQWTRETVTPVRGGRRIIREQWTGNPEGDAGVLVGRTDVTIMDDVEESA